MLCPLSLSSSSLCSDFPLNLSSFIFIFWKCLINSLELAVCYTGDTVINFDLIDCSVPIFHGQLNMEGRIHDKRCSSSL